jgi:hypothetical protein
MRLRQFSFGSVLLAVASISNCSTGPTREQRLVGLNQKVTGASLLEQTVGIDGSTVSHDDVRGQWESARAGYAELNAKDS